MCGQAPPSLHLLWHVIVKILQALVTVVLLCHNNRKSLSFLECNDSFGKFNHSD